MLTRIETNIRPKRASRPFSFALAIATDHVERNSCTAGSSHYRSRFLCTQYRLRSRIEIRFLHLETSVFDIGKMSEKLCPAIKKPTFGNLAAVRYRRILPSVKTDPLYQRLGTHR